MSTCAEYNISFCIKMKCLTLSFKFKSKKKVQVLPATNINQKINHLSFSHLLESKPQTSVI